MTKLFKRILPLFLIVLLITTFASCKKDSSSSYSYPNEYPTYTSKDAFLTVDKLTVTKENVYNRLLNSYGVDTLEFLLDNFLLSSELTTEETAGFEKFLNKRIYGDDYLTLSDEEKATLFDTFKTNCLSSGLKVEDSDKTNKLHYENYYKLQYKKELAVLKTLKEEVTAYDTKADEDKTDHKFSDSDLLTYFTDNFHQEYTLQLVLFSSYSEAIAAIKAAGVDTDKLNDSWKNTAGTALTKEEIATVFDNLSDAAYGEIKEAKAYSYKDLTKITPTGSQDYTLANKVAKLNTRELTNSYTHAPISFSGKWFLVNLKSTSDAYYLDSDKDVTLTDPVANYNLDGSAKELTEAAKTKLYELVVADQLLGHSTEYANIVERVMLKKRQDAGLEIYSEGLEVAYKTAYENVYSTLGITDFDAFKATTNTSSTLVAKLNGLEITTQNMYDALTERYGVLLSLLFVQQYAVLGSDLNKVINYATQEVLDQEKYDTYAASDYTAYKEAFESGSYEANGYPASYGWENFMRDYLGVTSEKDIVLDFSGALYNDVLDLYTKALYLVEEKDAVIYVPEGADDWYLKSDKWDNQYVVLSKDLVKDGTTPTFKLAYTEDDIKNVEKKKNDKGEEVAYSKNDYYGHYLVTYTTLDGNEKTILTDITIDQKVMELYGKFYNESFNATVSGIYTYFDVDVDGVADDIEDKDGDDDTVKADKQAKRNLAKSLADDLWNYAYSLFNNDVIEHNYPREKASEYLAAAIRTFSTSTEAIWTNYKKAGLNVSTVSGTSYTRTTSQSADLLASVKTMWTELKTLSSSVMGQTIDPIYRWVENDVVNNVKAMIIADGHGAVLSNNAYYRLVVTKPTSITAYTYETSTQKQTPNYYLYTQYQLATDKREVTVYCSSQFTSYYNPAVSELSSTTIVNKQLMNDAKSLLSKVTFSSNNEANIAALTKLIDAALAE